MIYSRFGSEVQIVGFTPASKAPDRPESDWVKVRHLDIRGRSFEEYPMWELRADNGLKEICDTINALPADKRFNEILT